MDTVTVYVRVGAGRMAHIAYAQGPTFCGLQNVTRRVPIGSNGLPAIKVCERCNRSMTTEQHSADSFPRNRRALPAPAPEPPIKPVTDPSMLRALVILNVALRDAHKEPGVLAALARAGVGPVAYEELRAAVQALIGPLPEPGP